MTTRILTQSDVARVLTLDDCITAVEEAFRAYGERRLHAPQSAGLHHTHGAFHAKLALGDLFAAKINANFPHNPERHALPAIQGLIVVIDPERGTPLAVMDSILVTTLRTAAATAVSAKYLARQNATTVTIIGCGNQGRANLEAMTRVRAIRHAFAWDHDAAIAMRFANEMRERLGITVDHTTPFEEALAASDIVVTCTPARSPILQREHLHPGVFIAGVGADNPEKHELAPELLAASNVVVDIIEQAATMGDLHHAIRAGVMRREDVHGELGDVVCGKVAARRNDEEIFVFDSTGTALQDVAAATVALARAIDAQLGTEIAFAR